MNEQVMNAAMIGAFVGVLLCIVAVTGLRGFARKPREDRDSHIAVAGLVIGFLLRSLILMM